MEHTRRNKHTTSAPNSRSNPVYFCTPAQASALLNEGRYLLLFVRHGLTDWNMEMRLQGREDIPLNVEGKIQAEEIASILDSALRNKFRINGVFTSPLSRAKDTAVYISHHMGLESPVVMDELIERDYAELSGLTLAERKEKYASPKDYPENMECVFSAASRLKKAALKLCNGGKTTSGATICVTHGGVINALFSYLTKGRAGTCRNIAHNCSISAVVACTTDVIPIFFNFHGEDLIKYIENIEAL